MQGWRDEHFLWVIIGPIRQRFLLLSNFEQIFLVLHEILTG
jgi:hypothetical protein